MCQLLIRLFSYWLLLKRVDEAMKGILIFDDKSDLAFFSLDKEMKKFVVERIKMLDMEAGVSASVVPVTNTVWIAGYLVHFPGWRGPDQRCTRLSAHLLSPFVHIFCKLIPKKYVLPSWCESISMKQLLWLVVLSPNHPLIAHRMCSSHYGNPSSVYLWRMDFSLSSEKLVILIHTPQSYMSTRVNVSQALKAVPFVR